jgi:hypothetical protein
MINLRSPLILKGLPPNRWELYFDVGELFSETTPFRDYLEQIRTALAAEAPADLRLPPAQGYDDCVEGELQWGREIFDIYFERSLSYFTLAGADEAAMKRALALIRPMIATA